MRKSLGSSISTPSLAMVFTNLPPAQDQLRRVERFLRRMENFDRPEDDYIDDLWAFFLNSWHLKDWVKADLTIPRDVQSRLEDVLKDYESLMICADLANRTKHHSLGRSRRDAMLTDRTTNLVVGGKGYRVESRTFVIELADGTTRDAHTVARQAVADWQAVFELFGIRRGAA